jgi:hypothetical protein
MATNIKELGMNRDKVKAKISDIGTLVAQLAEILDSQDDDAALAFLEVCQDAQERLSCLLYDVMAPSLRNRQ